ncbi:hypothetical protein ACFV23_09835 [Streptomyces sp. NPDC059627]
MDCAHDRRRAERAFGAVGHETEACRAEEDRRGPAAFVHVGLLLTAVRLRRRTEGLPDNRRICHTYARLTAAATAAGAAGWLIARTCGQDLAPASWTPALSLAAGGITMSLLFVVLARLLRIGEVRSLPGLG